MQEKSLPSLCPFCEPDIQDATFAESKNFRAIYNIAPILPGHALVIPRRHVESLLALDESGLGEMMTFARQVTQFLLRVFEGEAFDWTVQEGAAAGQSVPHLHLHIIPRQKDDLPRPGHWYRVLRDSLNVDAIDSERRPRLTPDQRREIVEHLREEWEKK
jgi:bis(5'-adenosyl)-triphosphatase